MDGSDNVYYLEDFTTPLIKKYSLVTGETTTVEVEDDREFTRTSRIFVPTTEDRIYTRVVWFNESADNITKLGNSAVLEIDAKTGNILSEISYEVKKHGSLHPFAVSPNRKYVFNIPIPYEGYLFDEMQYYTRLGENNWIQTSATFSDFRLEVGGGWNANTGQWLLSPDQSLLATSDANSAAKLKAPNCGGLGMGQHIPVQNQLKILDLDSLQVRIIRELADWENIALSHWDRDGKGVYFKIETRAPDTCDVISVSELQYARI